MKLDANKLFAALLLLGLTTILLIMLDVQYCYLRAIVALIFLTATPGLLIMLMLKVRTIGLWEYLVYTVGLSIAFIMFAGLAVNWILPWMHITDKPLSLTPLLASFDAVLSIFGIIAYKRNRELSLRISLPNPNRLDKVLFTFAIVFPILGVLGAITLNNGGSNYLTMVMLGGIAVYVLVIVLLREKLNEHVYPWAILLTSVSLLLMYSLRSWHIAGWDINQEYQMFQITKSAGYWSPDLIGHAYNSCLSLTILPTAISRFTNIPDETIYKAIYPLIFSFVPLSMYALFRSLSVSIIGFLAVFFFISQPFFIQPMAALARQEIAFVFFVLTLLTIFATNINARTSNIMVAIFGFSMVVSHYSTAYVAIGIYLAWYILSLLYRQSVSLRFSKRSYAVPTLHFPSQKPIVHRLSLTVILLIAAFTFLWTTQITGTARDLSYVLHNTISNMGSAFSNDLKSRDVSASLAIFSRSNGNTIENIRKYEKAELQSSSMTDTYDYSINTDLVPISNIEVNPITTIEFNHLLDPILAIVKLLTKVMLVIGPFALLFTASSKATIDRGFVLLSLVGIGVMLCIYILPVISQFYNLTRLYMQVLIFLSLPTVYGGFLVLRSIKHSLQTPILGTVFITYFLYLSGFVSQICGGHSVAQLNNFGDDYDKFYTHQVEVNSAVWLSKNRNSNSPVFADDVSALRLYAFGNLQKVQNTILPAVITKNSYVYLRYANVVRGRTDAKYNNMALAYTYPEEFLSQNKDLIYNNGGSQIFK